MKPPKKQTQPENKKRNYTKPEIKKREQIKEVTETALLILSGSKD